MKLLTFYSKNKCAQHGQTLVEFVCVYFFLFLCAVSVIEVARLLAFKNCLQAASSSLAQKIALSQIDLTQKRIISTHKGTFSNSNAALQQKLESELSFYLARISTVLISFDSQEKEDTTVRSLDIPHVRVNLKFVMQGGKQLPAGVYLESQTCLPVLFSSYFKRVSKSVSVGNAVGGEDRTCLGHFTSAFPPLKWFRVRVAAFSPWAASAEIFEHGLPLPARSELIDEPESVEVTQALNSQRLSSYFFEPTQHGGSHARRH